MRVNIYAEEITDRIELVQKKVDGIVFLGIRFYLELPVTIPVSTDGVHRGYNTFRGPFLHRDGDDDSSAITFWGKQDLRDTLRKALQILDTYYEQKRG